MIGAALRIWLSLHDDGIYWPDEIYQSLEPAHRRVFGYGLVAWEFKEGARNWTFPGLLAAFLKICTWIGLGEPRGYLKAVRLLMSSLSLACAAGTYLLARTFGARKSSAALGGAIWALAAPAIYFAPRATAESASALPVLFGVLLVNGPKERDTRARRLIGASLLGLAFLLRPHTIIVWGVVLAVLWARGQVRPMIEVAAVLCGWALLFGLIDRLAWGGWFQSLFVYWRHNTDAQEMTLYSSPHAWYFLEVLLRGMPLLALCLFALSGVALKRAPGLFLVVAAFVGAHSLVDHKELRFILPVLPIWCGLAAVGLDGLKGRLLRWGLFGVTALGVSWSAWHFHELIFDDVGQYPGKSLAQNSAYDDLGQANRLLLRAHDQADLCGLKVEVLPREFTGGYSYLHRRVPFYGDHGPKRESGFYNYVLVPSQSARGGEVVATDKDFSLLRLFPGGCAPDPASDPAL
jgi:hypothetical protein